MVSRALISAVLVAAQLFFARVYSAECYVADAATWTPDVTVTSTKELHNALVRVNKKGGPRNILLKPGTYSVRRRGFVIKRSNISLRGEPGARDKTIIRGRGVNGSATHVFLVQGARFKLSNLTLGWVKHHVVQVQGERGANFPAFDNVTFADTGQQLLKITGSSDKPSRGGTIRNSLFHFSKKVAPDSYTGGIDAHRAVDWLVENNVFRHIKSPSDELAEHAIHFWNGARGTIVRGNKIFDSDRGIGFGLGKKGHTGGQIENNFVHVVRDVGIGLENSPDTRVVHNTVFIASDYPNAIEYRFAETRNAVITANLTNAAIRSRNGGDAIEGGNVDYAEPEWFSNPSEGDLHLAKPIPNVTKTQLALPQIATDIDCDPRPAGKKTDIGADHTQLQPDLALVVAPPSELTRMVAYAQGEWRRVKVKYTELRAAPLKSQLLWAGVSGAAFLFLAQFVLLAYVLLRVRKLGKELAKLKGRRRSSSGLPKTLR